MSDQRRRYFRLTRAERASIERALHRGDGARAIAHDLGRSASSISDEVRTNRTVARGPARGERAGKAPQDACPRLQAWPWTCNGCRHFHYHCPRKWECEYSAPRAQALSDDLRSCSRRGIDMGEARMELVLATIRADIARGPSPAQIAHARAAELGVSTSTTYRWVEAGYGGMSNAEPGRKVGHRPRHHKPGTRPTAHGPGRSHAAFSELPEERRACACEMDTVMGRSRDTACVLTLFLRPCRFQLALTLPEKTSSAVAAALERSAAGGAARTRVHYCDVRQSQQKAGCERNHVELRKLLPKGRGIAFDRLCGHDMACVMSQPDSEPRPSLGGMTPIRMLEAAYGPLADALLDALGIEEIPYRALDLTMEAVEHARTKRGEASLV